MRCRTLQVSLCAVLLALSLVLPASAQQLQTTLVQGGFLRPVALASPPGDTQRLFIVEQHTGQIRIIKNGVLLGTPFLTVPGVTTGNEQGLLGLAFHPNYANNAKFYVAATVNGGGAAGSDVVLEYHATGDDPLADTANPALIATLLSVNDPQSNHNGGCLQFGPDGYLYYGLGDGGSANDTGSGHAAGGNAQTLTTYLGKMIRFDVDNPPTYVPASNPFASPTDGVLDLIWAYGKRNPWRFSFDRVTGDMYIADVGQNAWEEINFQPATSSGGENYGWRCMEGNHCTGLSGCTCNAAGLVLPIQEYGHSAGNCSITGGYVYRGLAIPALQGTYFYADYCSSTIWSFKYNGSVTNFTDRTAELEPAGALTINSPTSFGEDANGELYILDQGGGEVYRIDEVGTVGSPFCFGDLSCPCPAGSPTAGCNNENGGAPTGGAVMAATSTGGSPSVGADTTSPQVTLLMTNAAFVKTAIFFEGSTSTPPMPFGDGLICISGVIRLNGAAPAGDLTDGAGALSYPNAGHTLSICQRYTQVTTLPHPQASFHYQAGYRDPTPNTCTGFATVNISSALTLAWGP